MNQVTAFNIDRDIYNKLKSKLALKGLSVSKWLRNAMLKELEEQ